MKNYTITINEKERELIVYFMKKQLKIHSKLLVSTGQEKYKKEVEIRKSILESLHRKIPCSIEYDRRS
jgi:uncharacterized protein YggU (UPF0235/DUF167 family)